MDTPRSRLAEWGITRRKSITGYSLKEYSQPAYRRLPWHAHEAASICVVVAGSYTERVGGRERECAPQSMVFKPAGESHADQFGRVGGTCLLIEIDPGRLATIEPFSDVIAQPGFAQTARLAALGHQIYREFSGADPLAPLALEALILEVLVEASRAVVAGPATRRPGWLHLARDLIHERFRDALTLSVVAQAVGIHPSHLARTFRQHYRASIGAYVRRLRVEYAAKAVAGSDAPLAEIGLRSGFFDQSHFARVFKAHTGLTPDQFRAAARGPAARAS